MQIAYLWKSKITSNGEAISLKRVSGEFDYVEPSFSPDGQRFALHETSARSLDG